MKFLSFVPSSFRSLLAAGGITVAALALMATPITLSANAQDNSTGTNTAPSVSGNWQVSFTGANGAERQVTMQIKQDGKKLSGTFQGERGSAPLKGSLDENQVSISVKLPRRQASFTGTVDGDKMSGTTEQGASWRATRQQ